MRIDVLTLFPGMFTGPMTESMMWKAQHHGLLNLQLHDMRDYTLDKHNKVDDTPYGGGGGMVLRPDVVVRAVESVRDSAEPTDDVPVILMSPQGRLFSHDVAAELAAYPRLMLVSAHYEGVDERVRELVITDEISIGDYVLTGGELPAMVVIDAVTRHIPGVLGAEGGHERDSHAEGLLEGPHYTRPAVYRGRGVPEPLQQGDHTQIARWRRQESLRRTWDRRRDLLMKATLTEDDRYLLAEFAEEDARKRADT